MAEVRLLPSIPANSPILLDHSGTAKASSHQEFLHALQSESVEQFVEPQVAYSTEVAKSWNRPIRILLWIDGDHSFKGANDDLNLFLPYPRTERCRRIPRCTESVSRTDKGFCRTSTYVRSIWSLWIRSFDSGHNIAQMTDYDLKEHRSKLLNVRQPGSFHSSRGKELHGIRKKIYKLNRSRVPRSAVKAQEWFESLRIR